MGSFKESVESSHFFSRAEYGLHRSLLFYAGGLLTKRFNNQNALEKTRSHFVSIRRDTIHRQGDKR